jgi:cytochrome P450
MYPTSWMIGRDSLEEDNIKGIKIAKGAMVTLPIWAMHRDEKYYSKADEFIPERWTNEFLATIPKQAFTPFGYGVRSCIGETFAMYEFKIILSSLLLNFKFKLVKNVPLEIVTIIMARPKEEFEVSFVRR